MNKKRLMCVSILIGALVLATAVGAADQLPKKYTETVTTKDGSTLSFDMVLVPSGTFTMGTPAGEADRVENEGPQHKVQVDQFYMCTTEATLELFLAYYQETGTAKKDFIEVAEAAKNAEPKEEDTDTITGPTPVYGDMTMGYSKKHPAIGLSWHNAMTVCRWLSQKTGKQYRLPTEAEWEYACRAGTTAAFGAAKDEEELTEYGWFFDNADMEPHAVASLKPNAWGLYDMQGNVREWVHDFYSPTAYKDAAAAGVAKNPRRAGRWQGPRRTRRSLRRRGQRTALRRAGV